MQYLLAVHVLHYREWVRFLRSPGRIIGAIGAPFFFWLLLGSGLGSSFQSRVVPSGGGYLEYFFPGMLAMVILFNSIFASISLIEDRREGFLQAVLVTGVKRSAVVMGKVLGCATLATVQATLLLVMLPLLGMHLSFGSLILAPLIIFAVSFMLSALGFLCAWKFNSVQSFHSVMNLLLFPMWLLSGALFPAAGANSWVAFVMSLNPLTYGVLPLRSALYNAFPENFWPCIVALGGFSALFMASATWLVTRNRVPSNA